MYYIYLLCASFQHLDAIIHKKCVYHFNKLEILISGYINEDSSVMEWQN